MNQNAKKWIWITVLVVIIIVAAYLLFAKNTGKNNPIQNLVNKQSATENQNKNNTTLSGNANQSGSAMKNNQLSGPVSEEGSPEEKRSSEKPDEAFRQQTIAYVNQNLNKIATPPQNDEWDVPTFYFVGNSIVYLELYPVETDLAGLEILYKVEKDGNGIKLTQLAKKTEGDEDWILKEGKDEYVDYVMEQYDLNEDNNKWEKTDEYSQADYSDEVEASGEDIEVIMP